MIFNATYSLLLFLSMTYADLRQYKNNDHKQFVFKTMMYFPFMVALPKIAYHYELIHLTVLIPMICYLWQQKLTRSQLISICLIIAGIAISQFHAQGMEGLIRSKVPHFVPGLGLLIVMVGCTFYKLCTPSQLPAVRQDDLLQKEKCN